MKKIYLSIAFLFFITQAFCQFNHQVANASITTGTYTDLGAGGTAITTKFTGGTLTYDDDTSSVQNIGFNFLYNGATFTQFVLGTNGFIKLGSAAPADTYDPLFSTNSNLIVPFGEDLEGAPGAEYRVATTGAAGSRVCTIQYKNVKDYGEGGDITLSQYSSVNFQIKLYEGSNNIEFVYGTFTVSANPTDINFATVGVIGNSPATSVNATKASTGAWTTGTFLSGPYTANYFNNRNTVLPVSGTTVKFVAVVVSANDISIDNIYPLGSNGRGLQNVVRAYLKNAGTATKTNLQVTLTVTGANTFTSTVTIASLAPGAAGFLTFPAYTSNTIGTNTVTVSVPTDDNVANNSQTAQQNITANQIHYSIGTTASGNVNGGTGSEVAAKFAVPYPNSLSKVDIYFGVAGNLYDIIIYNNVGSAPGAVIGSLTGQTTAVGLNSITFPAPIAVSDSFYVSLKQTGAALNTSYQTETPLRSNAFFLKSTAAAAWFDLAGNSANTFRLMMGITTAAALPIQLTTFTGKLDKENAVLNWSVATEINNAGFEIEKSLDGRSFSKIGFVTGAGNSTIANSYQFIDKNIMSGNNFYRLKQIDKDNRFTYSSIIKLDKSIKNGFEVTVINPSKGKVLLQVVSETAQRVAINLYNLNGQLVVAKSADIAAGSNSLSIGQNLSKGTYIVSLVRNGEKISNRVIID